MSSRVKSNVTKNEYKELTGKSNEDTIAKNHNNKIQRPDTRNIGNEMQLRTQYSIAKSRNLKPLKRKPPKCIPDEIKDVWKMLFTSFDVDKTDLTNNDHLIFETFCYAFINVRKLGLHLLRLHPCDKDYSRFTKLMNEATAKVNTLCNTLGITPIGRKRITQYNNLSKIEQTNNTQNITNIEMPAQEKTVADEIMQLAQ